MAGGTSASWGLHEDVKKGDAPVSPAKMMLLHMLTPPTNSTFPLLCSPLSLHPMDLGVVFPCFVPAPGATEDVIPLAAEGSSSAKLEEAGGQGGAKQQEAQIDLFLPPLLYKNMKPCCHLLIHQPDRSSKSRLPTRFHFSPNLISVLNYKLIMGYH